MSALESALTRHAVDMSEVSSTPLVVETAHSRFPVVSEDKDHVEGILLAKDLLRYAFGTDEVFELKDVIRPAIVVPESKRVDVLHRVWDGSVNNGSIVGLNRAVRVTVK